MISVTRLFHIIFYREIFCWYLSARRVFPLSMFSLHCNFTIFNLANLTCKGNYFSELI